ncbi:kinase-associated lipoprotein B [Calidifontibacillus oryziterrae]|uniref:kinase-associated lipoprotein B n=1 Tax=Calidifontibacillus oryziterrae TaxID=1191699 RepID=UPI000305411B|nr:kinase-associated lipoprotein B [Calidifontibacillus oryziterrae]
MTTELQVGQLVTGIYKTGKYVGEITAIKRDHYTIRVKAVLKHPLQGDLHAPKESDVLFFHERRALAYNEQTNVPKSHVKPFANPVPIYHESLKAALSEQINQLEADNSKWAEESLKIFRRLEADYFKD